MGFWIFMTVFALLAPLMMIGFGKLFMKQAPKEINPVFGYRTERSMKNRDTWEFAHRYIGKLWLRLGLIGLPVSLAIMLAVYGGDEDMVGTAGSVLCLVQIVFLAGAIIPTERALKRTFDENGNKI